MADPHQQRPRKNDARKSLYSGLKPFRAVFSGDAASGSTLESFGIINDDTYQVYANAGCQGSPGDSKRIGAKPTSIVNAIVKWGPAKDTSTRKLFDLVNLEIGEAFPVSLGRWLEQNVVSFDANGSVFLWVAKQFSNQKTLSFHDWFDTYWRKNEHLSILRQQLNFVSRNCDADNITLNSMLLLACALHVKNVDFLKTFSYIDGWRMVGIYAKVANPQSSPSLPSFSEIATAFYAAISTGSVIFEDSPSASPAVVGRSSRKLARDILLSDLNVLAGYLSAINLSLFNAGSMWFLTERRRQIEIHRTNNLEEMRLFIDELTIGRTGYIPRL